ncbi:hypothetical protein MTO96_012338 [Rhipicephalus appendiculatus]
MGRLVNYPAKRIDVRATALKASGQSVCVRRSDCLALLAWRMRLYRMRSRVVKAAPRCVERLAVTRNVEEEVVLSFELFALSMAGHRPASRKKRLQRWEKAIG